MPDIFLSYNREDQAVARRFAEGFAAAGFDVWWDTTLQPGEEYDLVTENALKAAKAVVVLWSPRSVVSRWVRAEATLASRNKTLFPVTIEPCDRPVMFELHQTPDLSRWNGSPKDPAWQAFLASLRRFIGEERTAAPGKPPPVKPAVRPAAFARSKSVLAGLAVVALLGATGAWRYFSGQGASQGGSAVAILPFEATSDTDLARTTARALTTQLGATLNSSEIPTVSDEDAATLRGPNAAERLKALGVKLLFAGNVEDDGKTVSIQIRLNDPVNHLTLWSGSVSGNAADIAALRDEAANDGANLLACSNRALQPGGLTDPALLSHYLTACDLFANHDDATGAANTFELTRNLRAVIAGAPDFVPARTDLAKFSAYLAPTMPPTAAAAMRAEAAQQADAALKLQADAPDAWLAREMLLPPDEWAAREALLRKGVAFDPDWPHTNGFLAQLLQETGRMREAEAYAGRAAAAQLQIDWRPWGGSFACDAGDFDPATSNLQALYADHPVGFAKVSLIDCLVDAGRYRDALALFRPGAPTDTDLAALAATYRALASASAADRATARAAILELDDGNQAQLDEAVNLLGSLGEIDDAFHLADKIVAGYPRTGTTTAFLFTPPLAPMQRDPRFMRLAARLRLAQFWRASGKWPDFCSDKDLPYDCKAEAAKAVAMAVT